MREHKAGVEGSSSASRATVVLGERMSGGRRPTRRGMIRGIVTAVLVIMALFVATAAPGGDDAVQSGGDFEFVSPDGKTEINYPPQDRGTITSLSGPDLMQDDVTTSLSDPQFADKIVVVNTWGQWCGPCRSESDDLENTYKKYKSEGVGFLGINVRDHNKSAPQDFVRDHGISYPSIYDPGQQSLLAFRGFPISTTPTTLILDRQHRVATVFLGEVTEKKLGQVLDTLLKES